ncbi:hypothetical protein SPONN_281 [uncultured Candidatus Thioglobus sp.]|nr:hypothetical protein SPONN_281 [uncultured Candidatus Thioglobus sp.]
MHEFRSTKLTPYHFHILCPETEEDPEYWKESDDEVEQDIEDHFCVPPDLDETGADFTSQRLDKEQTEVVWWVVAFTCAIQSLHSLPLRAIGWLLKFLVVLLTFLGKYSDKISNIAEAVPSSLFLRNKFICDRMFIPPIRLRIVCRNCHSLCNYEDCFSHDSGGGQEITTLPCSSCISHRKRVPLLRTIVTCKGTTKYYPFLSYPYCSLISTLRSMLLRPGFLNLCEEWRECVLFEDSKLRDVYDGRIWREFMTVGGKPFLSTKFNLTFIINIDWFQPFKHRTYSIGVMYLCIINLPRGVRFKRENVILLGLIPGPSEPSVINSYIAPHVSDFLSLWDGVNFLTSDHSHQIIRGALICVACDLPAARKVSGFLSHAANFGCSRCYSEFSTGVFGKNDYSGFSRESWVVRTNEKHRQNITKRKGLESKFGCRYSSLLELPYFDPIKMTILDPMHNLYLGTSKYILKLWMKQEVLDQAKCVEINRRILLVAIPSNFKISRLPPTIESVSSFTAEQMMIWVNFYSIFCLHKLLPDEHLECWRHFVLASRLLSKHQMTSTDVIVADTLLLSFCRRFEHIYGSNAVMPNMHMHSHLLECVKDFGPMCSFWLFSFERYNGILGDQPTNNCAIESQLLKRFIDENFNLQLLHSGDTSSDAGKAFGPIVKEHAFGFYSLKHLDTHLSETVQSTTSNFIFTPALKYTLGVLQERLLPSLKTIYCALYPLHSERISHSDFILPRTYRKMNDVTIAGRRLYSGQYVHAKPFCSIQQEHSVATVFSDPGICVAELDHFAVHSFEVSENTSITHAFAIVNWLEQNPNKDMLGKPCEVWYKYHDFINDACNMFLPLENVSCLLVTAEFVMENQEEALVVVPLLV